MHVARMWRSAEAVCVLLAQEWCLDAVELMQHRLWLVAVDAAGGGA